MFSAFVQYLFILSSYPLARWILPHIKTRNNSIIFHITFGFLSCVLLYKTGLISALVMLTIGYYILDNNPYIVLLISFSMNFLTQLLQLYFPNHPRVCSFSKMIFFKIVATSFNLYDGKKLKTKDDEFTKRQKITYLTQKPTLYEWLAYCFTPFGAVSLSFYEFRLFNIILEIGSPKRQLSKESQTKAFKCLQQSFLHFTVYFGFRHLFSLKFYKSEFFLSLNVIVRIFLVLFLGVIIYSRFFMQWKAVDAGLYEAGFLDSGIIEEDEFNSLSLFNLLSKSSTKEFSKAFNHTTNLFWSNYLKSRAPESGISQSAYDMASFFLKPFLRGPYGGYLLGAFERKLFVSAESYIQFLAPKYTSNFFWAEYIFTQVFMIANKASIRFKTIHAFIYVNYVILFFFWMSASAIIVVGFFLSKKVENEKKEKTEETEDQQHVKKD
ncbi:Lysophospholipid acyltransferase 1 [Tritrichomonas musculus]|uniref:Lysophospholipid acyltransferase 1 n=1 Tax=Tritrichomonas musculus TaxID=1915356 RepID=A0ABR2GVQ5_9EUKA